MTRIIVVIIIIIIIYSASSHSQYGRSVIYTNPVRCVTNQQLSMPGVSAMYWIKSPLVAGFCIAQLAVRQGFNTNNLSQMLPVHVTLALAGIEAGM